jgi:hypothetical protein
MDEGVVLNFTICSAIRTRRLLRFEYGGHPRVVAPYCYGITATGAETLRAIEVGGTSKSAGFGKLWTVAKMEGLTLTSQPFEPSDPNYNPNDKALVQIHCRI